MTPADLDNSPAKQNSTVRGQQPNARTGTKPFNCYEVTQNEIL